MSILPNTLISPDHGDPGWADPYPVSQLVRTDFHPVRSVSLELFAEIARTLAASTNSHLHGTELAEAFGVDAKDWRFACRVWNTRIADNPAVARRLSQLFRAEALAS